jgi:xylulokinase
MTDPMQETILAIDIGLTNCRTVLYSPDGRLLARASIAYPTTHPAAGRVEQDPEAWWRAVLDGLSQLRERAPGAVASVAAMSVTGHMHALVCLGDNGQALGPALVLGDLRSVPQAESITANLGLERIYALTGARMDASMPLAKLAWLREHAPAMHSQARAFLGCKDFIRHRLTADLFTDPIDACGTSLYDIHQRAWSPELAAQAGIRGDQLPQVVDPWQLAGTLRDEPARALGLRTGIPVVVGAGDDIEVVGSGLVQAGKALEHLGTTGAILAPAGLPLSDPTMALELYPHALPGLWVIGGSTTSAGAAHAWSHEVLQPERDGPDGSGRAWGRPNLANPLIFVPHLAGERSPAWDPRMRGSWLGLSLTHSAADLRQAVKEGIAFSLKRVLEQIESLAGRQAHLVISDRKDLDFDWLGLRATIYQRPLAVLAGGEPTALGAMMLAAVGIGAWRSLAEAVQSVIRIDRVIEPQPDLMADYERLYRYYVSAAEAMRPLMRAWDSTAGDGRAVAGAWAGSR